MKWVAKVFGKLVLEVNAYGHVTAYMRLFERDYEVDYKWIQINEYEL